MYELIDVFIYLGLLFDTLADTTIKDSPEQFKFLFDRKMEELYRRMKNQSLGEKTNVP